MLAGKETEGFSPRADATLTNRSVRRGSPNSAAPKVSTAHASAFCNVSVFIPLSPLLFCAPLFFNVRLPYKCQDVMGTLTSEGNRHQAKSSSRSREEALRGIGLFLARIHRTPFHTATDHVKEFLLCQRPMHC